MSDSAAPHKTKTVSQRLISACFDSLAQKNELGLVAYLTAGDPTIEASEQIILAAAQSGADIIELGVPFSDPVADGPTIQRASERSLRAGTTLPKVLALAARLKRKIHTPLVIFSYYNPIFQMGLEKFASEAHAAGIDGVLATDMIPEESADYRAAMNAQNLDTIFLAAPTSTPARLQKIAAASQGFLYLVARTGVTGTRENLPSELAAFANRVRGITNMPIAVGFGISQPAHIAALAGVADAAVVGSALVAKLESAATADEAAQAVRALVHDLKTATKSAAKSKSSVTGTNSQPVGETRP
jgi:tryptophan synthase alpha chain